MASRKEINRSLYFFQLFLPTPQGEATLVKMTCIFVSPVQPVAGCSANVLQLGQTAHADSLAFLVLEPPWVVLPEVKRSLRNLGIPNPSHVFLGLRKLAGRTRHLLLHQRDRDGASHGC